MTTIAEEDASAIRQALGFGTEKVGKDIGVVLAAAGYAIDEARALELAKELEVDLEGPLTLAEACRVAGRLPAEFQMKARTEKAFAVMDKHKDGTITTDDLQFVLQNITGIPADEIELLLDELDFDDIGRVHITEVFKAFAKRVEEF